jgi:7-carboxy-7-deazaguanine synthase
MSPEEVCKKLKEHLPKINPMLVISGGEPLLQQDRLATTMEILHNDLELEDLWIEVETAGTIAPELEFDYWIDAYNVSPKLEHSGNALSLRYRPEALEALRDTGKVQGWKFVAQEPSDLDEIADLVAKHELFPVYVMPEGKNQADLSRHAEGLVEAIIARGWRMTPRLHIQLWGTERGR